MLLAVEVCPALSFSSFPAFIWTLLNSEVDTRPPSIRIFFVLWEAEWAGMVRDLDHSRFSY